MVFNKKNLSIGGASERLGISESTLRRLELEGLIPKAERRLSGWREYEPEDIKTIRHILIKRKNHNWGGIK